MIEIELRKPAEFWPWHIEVVETGDEARESYGDSDSEEILRIADDQGNYEIEGRKGKVKRIKYLPSRGGRTFDSSPGNRGFSIDFETFVREDRPKYFAKIREIFRPV